ncbi:MAG: DUF4377 domain-containing protein [Clostridium sp.]|nr:DUF4377 domain-containing protein [Bacteroides sp.]MCM1199381.1 DUF4377 domain-containing protein [Clostridium sp.]
MKSIYNIMYLFLPCLLFSCAQESRTDNESQSWEERWIVASETVKGYNGMTCLWIKRNGNPVWEMTNANVKGFGYESGYEYVVDVKATVVANPPEDGSQWEYSLIRIISKEQKASDVPILTQSLYIDFSIQ